MLEMKIIGIWSDEDFNHGFAQSEFINIEYFRININSCYYF